MDITFQTGINLPNKKNICSKNILTETNKCSIFVLVNELKVYVEVIQ